MLSTVLLVFLGQADARDTPFAEPVISMSHIQAQTELAAIREQWPSKKPGMGLIIAGGALMVGSFGYAVLAQLSTWARTTCVGGAWGFPNCTSHGPGVNDV